MIKYLLIIVLLLNFIDVNAQQIVIKKATVDTSKIIQSNSMSELAAYKLMYENAKEANSTLHNILWSSLALFGGFILFIIGSQLFFNVRLNTRDLENLKSEILLKFTKDLNEFDSSQQSKLDIIEDSLKKSINESDEALRKRVHVVTSSINTLYGKFYASTGDGQLAVIRLIAAVNSCIVGKTSPAYSLNELYKSLKMVSEINQRDLDAIHEILVKVKTIQDEDFGDVLNNIEQEVLTKVIE